MATRARRRAASSILIAVVCLAVAGSPSLAAASLPGRAPATANRVWVITSISGESGFAACLAESLRLSDRLPKPLFSISLCGLLAGKAQPFRTAGGRAAIPGGYHPDSNHRDALIALTFDDGPKPYVLLGGVSKSGTRSPSLLDLLDREHVKATFFVMGYRLAPSADDFCRRDGGETCRAAAEEEHRRGEEIENHTYGHGDFRLMQKRYGEAWILNDIDRASKVIEGITGSRPHYLRPPDWDIWPELGARIEARGYHVMSKSTRLPPEQRDVDSEDYFCVGRDPKCPKPSLHAFVLGEIDRRERQGVHDHILAFHELPGTVELLSTLIPELKARGYTFVTLNQYMRELGSRE